MISFFTRSLEVVAASVGALLLLALPAQTQPIQTLPIETGQPASDADRNSPSHMHTFDMHIVVHPDATSTTTSTTRIKILRDTAIRNFGQQNLQYLESLETLEIIEAYTEKPDRRRSPVDPPRILTRDAATGLDGLYLRDSKVTTLIFPDIEIGDTLVWVSKSREVGSHFPGYVAFDYVLPKAMPIDSFRLVVDEPKSMPLRVSTRGDGFSHEIVETDAGRQHRLRAEFAAREMKGTMLEQWQYEVTSGGRIWYCPDPERRIVWITWAGTGHPKATD